MNLLRNSLAHIRQLRDMTPLLFSCIMFTPLLTSAQDKFSPWVDSVYSSLSAEERIAQLFIIRAYSAKTNVYDDSLAAIVRKYKPGGLCFFQGSPVRQASLVNRLQDSVRTPMIISIDAEWGLGMRLDSAFSFPRQIALGSIKHDTLIYNMGRIIGKDCRRMGIHFNFAPVADVNNNPLNPVIGFRSFGEDRRKVAGKSILFMKGMQDEGILPAGKHFPGHGDTDFDSHYTLPLINHDRKRLDSIELYPFRALIREGLQGIMVAHLYMPQLDTTPNTATTLSPVVITGLLRNEMGFKGYVVTDALDMQGVTKYFKPGEIEVKALLAGNDILLLPQHIDLAINGIKTAIDSGRISPELLEYKCKRILALKEKLGLDKPQKILTEGLTREINSPGSAALASAMVKESLTLLSNPLQILPIQYSDRRKIAVLSIGDTMPDLFAQSLARYADITAFRLPKQFRKNDIDSIIGKLSPFDLVIAGVYGISSNPGISYGITAPVKQVVDSLSNIHRTILTLFGTPYALNMFTYPQKCEAVIIAYQDNALTRRCAAGAIFGGIPLQGTLPVSTTFRPAGTSETTEKTRLETAHPEEIGIPSEALYTIDSIVNDGISNGAYPGCQVLLAKHGKVFFEKAYGNPSCGDSMVTGNHNLYDLASITKIAATTLAIMKLYDERKITLNDRLEKFLPETTGTDKAHLKIGDIMAHQAGLQDWIPFYKNTLKHHKPDPHWYRHQPADRFSVPVCRDLYIRDNYHEVILEEILRSPLKKEGKYRYSDLGFYLLRIVVERITEEPFEQYLSKEFYKPLGLQTMTFNPLEKFPVERIMPTEDDHAFRHQWIRGYVHDPGAAMLGGISGHAGLFSNAGDLAVILQMLLNKGSYGGHQYLAPATVEKFTSAWDADNHNRRSPGFDKPLLEPSASGPSCISASPLSFGHSGFTGTYVWADPKYDLLYVFLSNRVCPDASNNKLSGMNIRTSIHQKVYDLLINSESKSLPLQNESN